MPSRLAWLEEKLRGAKEKSLAAAQGKTGPSAERTKALNALANQQLSAGEQQKLGASLKTVLLARALADDEEVHQLFAAYIGTSSALVALTDRRLLAAYGFTHTATVDYSAISQIQSGRTDLGLTAEVELKGAGVELKLRDVGRRQQLVNELERRRAVGVRAPAATGSGQPMQAVGSVADELKKLAELRDSGVLTEEQFEAQKAKLLAA